MYHTDETRFYQTDDSKVTRRLLKEKSKLTFVDVQIMIFIACLLKGSQEQSFFLQTLLFTSFLVTVLKNLTYALVSTRSLVSSE